MNAALNLTSVTAEPTQEQPAATTSPQPTPPRQVLADARAGQPVTTPARPHQPPSQPAAAAATPVVAEDTGSRRFVELMTSLDQAKERVTSIIGLKQKFRGNIEGCEGVLVRGEVFGDILVKGEDGEPAGTIMITETGKVHGLVAGDRVIVVGEVDAVASRTSLVVASGGRIRKATYYKALVCADGAELEGVIRKISEDINEVDAIRKTLTPSS